MNPFGIWRGFGFSANPYSHETLAGDATGDRLLVGRDREVLALQRQIASRGLHATVEGPVGAGKSSMIAVSLYRMKQRTLAEAAGTLFLPSVTSFQASDDVAAFEDDVWYAIGQTLLRERSAFESVGLPVPHLEGFERWLNDPEYTQTGGGISVAGFGGEFVRGAEPNTSDGFRRAGFARTIRDELARVFPSADAGALVCVLDNLEILRTTGAARDALDALRDRLFNNVPQVRWVLCGSRGIVSRARTERLSGIFSAPLQVAPLSGEAAITLTERRIDFYGAEDARAPVTPTGFRNLYSILNSNLRDALARSQEFAHVMAEEILDRGQDMPSDEALDDRLAGWIDAQAAKAEADAKGVQQRNWQFFDDLAARGGRAGSGEWEAFGFGFQQQLVAAVSQLADANLVEREVDPENGSRTVNSVTPVGWLVHHHRSRSAVGSDGSDA